MYQFRRFIINVPETAKQNLIRICFQIELAYWYYLDFYVNNERKLKSCGFKEFAAHVFQVFVFYCYYTILNLCFQHLPFLQSHANRLDTILEEWRYYKQSVPTYGAILLSEGNTHVLLVQSYCAKSSWGFPKGKVNEAEDPAHCAIREVYEETGFDIANFIDPENYLESLINEQLVRLYVIAGISRDTVFQPRTRYEIKACKWFPVADLPNNKKDNTPRVKMGVNPNSFFMVLPFVKHIKGLTQNGKIKRQRHKSSSLSENESTCKSKTKIFLNHRPESEIKVYKNNDKKHSKRQLFKDENEEVVFSAPSWLNFKFDKAAILECIP